MFAEAIETTDLDHVARSLWQGFASGAIGEDEASRLAMLLEARRGVARAQDPGGHIELCGALSLVGGAG